MHRRVVQECCRQAELMCVNKTASADGCEELLLADGCEKARGDTPGYC
jgi:hypothetical protein